MDQWNGPTYYGRPQLKAAPFNNAVVGGYVFLAGLSGGAQLLSTLLNLTRGRQAASVVRLGRQLAWLAPTLGSGLLIWDLHTPKRFYNMLRVFKTTSPMSLGTWILSVFTGCSAIVTAAEWLSRRTSRGGWLRRAAQVAQIPAAAAGAGLGTYTASLLAATSTPLWAAAPRALAVRFAASSVASAAAALSLFADAEETRRDLNMVCASALVVEATATMAAETTYRQRGVHAALQSTSGRIDRIGAFGLGTMLPLGLLAVSLVQGERSRRLSSAASLAVLGGSLMMRIAVMGAGDVSASRPEISMRFAQPR